MSSPKEVFSQTVRTPEPPTIVTKAKASITPPNWARTLDAESIAVRRNPSARVPRSAKQTSAPTIAPTIAVSAESQIEFQKSVRMFGFAKAARLAKVNVPVEVKNPLPTASTAGMARNRSTYAANGVRPSQTTLRRRDVRPAPQRGLA